MIREPLGHCRAEAANPSVLFDGDDQLEIAEAARKERFVERFDRVDAGQAGGNSRPLQLLSNFACLGDDIPRRQQRDPVALAQDQRFADLEGGRGTAVKRSLALLAQPNVDRRSLQERGAQRWCEWGWSLG